MDGSIDVELLRAEARPIRLGSNDNLIEILRFADGATALEFMRTWRNDVGMPLIVIDLARKAGDVLRAAIYDAGASVIFDPDDGPAAREAHLEALRRRHAMAADKTLRIGSLEINLDGHSVRVGGRKCFLPMIQWQILLRLARNANRIVTPTAIMDEIWGRGCPEGNMGKLKVHMTYLRRALGPDAAGQIKNVRGEGWRLVG